VAWEGIAGQLAESFPSTVRDNLVKYVFTNDKTTNSFNAIPSSGHMTFDTDMLFGNGMHTIHSLCLSLALTIDKDDRLNSSISHGDSLKVGEIVNRTYELKNELRLLTIIEQVEIIPNTMLLTEALYYVRAIHREQFHYRGEAERKEIKKRLLIQLSKDKSDITNKCIDFVLSSCTTCACIK